MWLVYLLGVDALRNTFPASLGGFWGLGRLLAQTCPTGGRAEKSEPADSPAPVGSLIQQLPLCFLVV